MRRALLALTSLAALSACNAPGNQAAGNAGGNEAGPVQTDGGQVGISGASVRLPAVPGRPGAAYLTIRNGGEARVLKSVSTAKAERAEIHESKMEGGVMRMGKLDGLPLPAGATVSLAPGGMHIMLFGLDPALKAGDTIPLDLEFADGTTMRVQAKAQSIGDGGVSHSGH